MFRYIIFFCLSATSASAQDIREIIEIQATDRINAFSLLTQSMMPDTVLNSFSKDHPIILKAVAEVAVELEIMDQSEVRYFFIKSEEFSSDLRIINQRYQELKDAPKLADSHRLPPRQCIIDLIIFNRAYDTYLNEYIIWNQDRADLIRDIKKENQMLYHVYELIRDAKADYYHVSVRRAAMLKLKKLLNENDFLRNMPGGEDFSYETMTLPPNIPIWRFNEKNVHIARDVDVESNSSPASSSLSRLTIQQLQEEAALPVPVFASLC